MKNSNVFKFYEILVDTDKFNLLVDDFIKNVNLSFKKIISSNSYWFYYKDKIFDNKKYKGFFEFALINRDYLDCYLVNSFKYNLDSNHIKCVKIDNEYIFFYTVYPIEKYGCRYNIKNSIIISEEVYNLIMIKERNFNLLTVNSLKDYKEYFKVNDMPYKIVSENSIEDEYRTKKITLERYKYLLKSYKHEEELVKTLKKN